jgi:NAD(P)-dependent dehydrogenase (short-subunit alcohol dehydrogenase family)
MGILDGKVGIVTGAAQGIGKGMATALAKEGMAVTITDIQAEKVVATGAELRAQGLRVLDIVADGCSGEQVDNAVARTVEEFGSIFLLVNCAQAAVTNIELQDQTVEQVNVGIDTGFWASFRYMKACFPHLKESQGTVVNFGSQAGLLGNWGMVGYNAAKEAIRGLTRTAAREWGPYNVTVNNIIPGMLTEGSRQFFAANPERAEHSLANIPMGRFGEPELEIGALVVFLCTPGAHYITGDTFNVDGGRCLRP